MIAAFQQRFHYAIRGVVPGVFFMAPFAMMLCFQHDVELWWVVSLFCLGGLGGFFAGAMLDKIERCQYEGGEDYQLVYYLFLTMLAASVGATLSGFAVAAPVMADEESAIAVALLGAWPGLILGLWLESLREPSSARIRARGGILPRGAWVGLWLVLASLEGYVLWNNGV